jgi:hypothetical protein
MALVKTECEVACAADSLVLANRHRIDEQNLDQLSSGPTLQTIAMWAQSLIHPIEAISTSSISALKTKQLADDVL